MNLAALKALPQAKGTLVLVDRAASIGYPKGEPLGKRWPCALHRATP